MRETVSYKLNVLIEALTENEISQLKRLIEFKLKCKLIISAIGGADVISIEEIIPDCSTLPINDNVEPSITSQVFVGV